jgi:hypothetical protein
MALSIVIGCFDFDKRKCLISLLESRNDMVRHDWQQSYKFTRTEHVHMYVRMCESCHSPSSQGLYKTKYKIQNK